ncbi:MAG TPA: phage terminase large subunit [bacterium]|nr:phage terminase large subunit [bacterium]
MKIKIKIDYEPNEKQYKFHTTVADEVVYGGAKGGGKSLALTMEAVAYALKYTGANVYIFRKTFDDLKASIVKEILMRVKNYDNILYKYNQAENYIKFYNGSIIYLRHLKDTKSAYEYNGRSMDFVGIDELTEHTEEVFLVLLSCVRSIKGYPALFRGTCNPGGVGHNWVKKRYVDATEYGKNVIKDEQTNNTIAFIPAKVYDNKALLKQDPTYINRLNLLNENLRKAYLDGNWDVFTGQYFTEWDYNIHTIERFQIPNYWKKFVSIDWGYNNPCAVLWHAVDNENRIYTYRELYIKNTLASDVAKKIREMSIGEIIDYYVGSPDMFQKRGLGLKGESIAEIFYQNNINIKPADNNRLLGWNRVREYLGLNADGKPNILIFRNCINLIRTFPLMQFDSHNLEDISASCEDHALESLRYALMSRPRPNSKNSDIIISDNKENRILSLFQMRKFLNKNKSKIYAGSII